MIILFFPTCSNLHLHTCVLLLHADSMFFKRIQIMTHKAFICNKVVIFFDKIIKTLSLAIERLDAILIVD